MNFQPLGLRAQLCKHVVIGAAELFDGLAIWLHSMDSANVEIPLQVLVHTEVAVSFWANSFSL